MLASSRRRDKKKKKKQQNENQVSQAHQVTRKRGWITERDSPFFASCFPPFLAPDTKVAAGETTATTSSTSASPVTRSSCPVDDGLWPKSPSPPTPRHLMFQSFVSCFCWERCRLSLLLSPTFRLLFHFFPLLLVIDSFSFGHKFLPQKDDSRD